MKLEFKIILIIFWSWVFLILGFVLTYFLMWFVLQNGVMATWSVDQRLILIAFTLVFSVPVIVPIAVNIGDM